MSKATETRKVGSKNKASQDKPKKERTPRKAFDLKTATDAKGNVIGLNDDGKLTGAPVNWTADFAPLKRSNFADRATHLEWKAAVCDAQIANLTVKRDELLEQAKEARSGKPSKKRQKAKLEKLRKQIAELESLLGEDGVDTDA